MSAHARRPDHPAEALLAMYSSVRSSAFAEWSYRHPTIVMGAVLLMLTFGFDQYSLLRVGVLVGLIALVAAVMSVREASGNVDRIIREVQERENNGD